jgi:hypothetical protein
MQNKKQKAKKNSSHSRRSAWKLKCKVKQIFNEIEKKTYNENMTAF